MRPLTVDVLAKRVERRQKIAAARLDYQFDWSDFLGNDTIASATVTIVDTSASPVTADGTAQVINAGTGVVVWLQGGTPGTVALITVTVTTTGDGLHTRIDPARLELGIT